MRIISHSTLIAFYTNPQYRDSKDALEAWYFEAKHAEWRSPMDVIQHYPKASIIADNRIVFNIRGNKYRLIIKFHYKAMIGYVRFIGTHKEYDAINAEKI